jgi:NAD(P)-dependent dehydrogenase (short-subunit alcohol dehydrogenase family)
MTGNNDQFWFAGKTVIVTGGNGGIGQGIVKAFSERDANVVIADIGAALVPQKSLGVGKILDIPTDITDRASVDALVAKVREEFGRIDVLINNAGRGEGMAPLLEVTPHMIDWMVKLNIYGTFNMTQAVSAVMAEAGQGSVVMISSGAALHGRSGRFDPIYAGAKGFLNSFAKALAAGLGEKGIRFNTVAPGWIVPESSLEVSDHSFWTTMTDKFGTPDSFNADYEKNGMKNVHNGSDDAPLKRLGRPRDIAAACVYFASDAASYATGQILSIAGGNYMPS